VSRNKKQSQILECMDRGMPSAANLLARQMGVEFNSKTLRRWVMDQRNPDFPYRATYAVLALDFDLRFLSASSAF
jgi:hypothetical protein